MIYLWASLFLKALNTVKIIGPINISAMIMTICALQRAMPIQSVQVQLQHCHRANRVKNWQTCPVAKAGEIQSNQLPHPESSLDQRNGKYQGSFNQQ